jgi:hypothetical protein
MYEAQTSLTKPDATVIVNTESTPAPDVVDVIPV